MTQAGADAAADLPAGVVGPATSFRGTQYGFPVGGTATLLAYRSDAFEAASVPPEALATWSGVIAAAAAMAGRDLDGSGAPGYGFCFPRAAGAQ